MPSSEIIRLEWIDEVRAAQMLAGRGSWRQYPGYSREAARRVGAISRYALVSDAEGPLALANCRTRRAAGGLLSAILVSHGPALLRPVSQAQLDQVTEALRKTIVDEERGELIIDPDPAFAEHSLEIPGGTTSADGYRTILLDISGSEEDIRAAFNGKWRTDLRRSEKEGLELREVTDPDKFGAMTDMLAQLADSKGFSVPQNPGFFAACARHRAAGEHFVMQEVLKDGEVLSRHLGAYGGDRAVYLLGATNEKGRALRAAYLAQWGAILTARRYGLKLYDTGGIDPESNPHVHRFKKRMGGQDVTTPGPTTFAAPGWRGMAIGLAKAWRKRKMGG